MTRFERLLGKTIWIGRFHFTWLGLWPDEPHRWRPEIGWYDREPDAFGRHHLWDSFDRAR